MTKRAEDLLQRISRRRFVQSGSLFTAGLALPGASAFAAPAGSPGPVVRTPLGSLQGVELDGVRIFRGIPFAQPPTGPLRFRSPAKLAPWSGVRDATHFRPAAMQAPETGLEQSEDCLYLNVWTPAARGPHPVFVWIHGGSFTGGRATAPIFDGSHFAREGILCVTVAYRLGVFGFMDLAPLLGEDFADSGNNAVRDLVAALGWVHENIAAFDGEPARVTVGGESAGAKATAALMAVPEARVLFQSAISESGGGERVLSIAGATEVAQIYGEQWRRTHPRPSTADGFADLLTAPAPALIDAQLRLVAESSRHFPFRPEAGGSLLPGRPVDLVAKAPANGRRLLIGTNRDESALFLGPHPSADPAQRDLGNLSLARFNEVLPKYRALYPEMSDAQRRIRAVTAEEYWVPSVRLADAHTRSGGSAWMYRLDYAEPSGDMAGESFHSLDLSLVWERLNKIEQGDGTAPQLAASMHGAWCSFIRGGDSAAAGLPPWPQYSSGERATMILSEHPHIEQRPLEAELRLWDAVL